MTSHHPTRRFADRCARGRATQRGAAAVDFALVSVVFFTLLIGVMEMGRLTYLWNTTAEATRLGARMAVVCDLSDPDIKARMRDLLPIVSTGDIGVAYTPGGCNVNTCQFVTVSIATTTPIQTYIPFLPMSVLMPSFSTTLPRESMQSTFGGVANPICV